VTRDGGSSILSNWSQTIVVLGAIAAGFWQLADPRQDIKDTKANFNNYLTLREHEEFVRRFTSDITRIESVNLIQTRAMVTKSEAEAHAKADAAQSHAVELRLDAMQRQLDLLIQRSLAPNPNGTRPP
jgi:hypothetical protein